jgi:hypothetical protein
MDVPAAFAAGAGNTQEALDRAEISNVMTAAVYAHDNNDNKAFAALFTPDGIFRVNDPTRPVAMKAADMARQGGEGGPPAGGPPAGGPTAGGTPAGGPPPGAAPPMPGSSHHNISNLHITLKDATHAKLRGYYTLVARQPDGKFSVVNIGGYDNDFIKINGKWLIQNYNVIFGPVKVD